MDNLTAEQCRLLADEKFNQLLQNDPVLKDLENLKYEKNIHSRVLLETLGLGEFRIGNLPVLPLTAAKWAFLWILDNGFVSGAQSLSDVDLDVMLYILSVQSLHDIDCALHEIPAAASKFHFAPKLSREDLIIEINGMIQQAFLPLEMLPGNTGSKEDVHFDEIWLTAVAGCAARESGNTLEYCMHNMSLSSVFALWINYRRREGSEARQIRYRTPMEIEQKISERFEVLAEEYLIKV